MKSLIIQNSPQQNYVYFFHIPKTAGASVWQFIHQMYPAERICPWWLWDQLITVPSNELRSWTVFRGHFLSHLEAHLQVPLATFTVLRDPVERTISHYYHVRSAPEHPFHKHASGMTLAEFCDHPETRHMVENYQAAYLAKKPCVPITIAHDLTRAQLESFQLQQRLQYPDKVANPTALLDAAESRLAGFLAVGITELLDESLVLCSRELGCSTPLAIEPQNVNPQRARTDTVDRCTLARIRQLTEVDQHLYQRALSAHRDKWKRTGCILATAPTELPVSEASLRRN
ncbi:MAG TPA: sulfotransferase family 2 domain-containing protein [Chthoniobacterales bacterium]|jgi:hypothetical protein